jgi:hypothetical protein
MYDCLRDLVHAARDILHNPAPEVEDVIMPQENARLLESATACVIATGDCFHKTKSVIERIGDFEFEFDNAGLTIDLDLSCLEISHPEPQPSSVGLASESASISESTISDSQSIASTAISSTPKASLHKHAMSVDKPLPLVPPGSPTAAHYSPPASRPPSFVEDTDSSMASSLASLRPTLPPLPKISTSLMPSHDSSPTEHSAGLDVDFHSSFRSESINGSSAGSASTYLSRDSESSVVSQSSTRATTPETTLVPQPSLSDLSAAGSFSTNLDEVDDVESRLLEKTFAHELIFNKEGQVTGGSLPALVERLTTHEATPDAMFVSTFYLTFRLFCSPRKLAETLIDRFDYVGEAPHMASPVRLRVYNIFKGWLESHWRDDTDREALPTIQQFAELRLAVVLPSAGKRLMELTTRVSASDGTLVPRLVSSMGKTNTSISQYVPADTPLPPSTLSKSSIHSLNLWKAGGHCPNILDFEPLEIARQLTIKQMNVFCSIMPDELLGSQWMKKGGIDAPNVKAMSSFSTDLSNLVADTVLQHGEVKKRAAVIKQWIKIAHQCVELNNYDALMAIICSLNSSTITRLRKTWDALSPKRREMLRMLQSIVEPSQNNKVLRTRLQGHVPPCLPFLGMFLTDLTFVDIGNPATKVSDTGLTVVNFDKHTRTAKIIGDLQRFQIPYRLTEIPDLQDWLQYQVTRVREMEKSGTNAQVSYYRKSLLLEPRESTIRTPIEGPANGMFGWMRSNSHPTTAAQV